MCFSPVVVIVNFCLLLPIVVLVGDCQCVFHCCCHCDLLFTLAYLLLSGWVLLWIQVPVGVEVPSPCPPLFQCYHTAKCHI